MKTITISKEALIAYKQMCDAVESVHHTNISRADIIKKLEAIDRPLINQCQEDLTKLLEEYNTIPDATG